MEITTRHRRLVIAAFAAITCMLLLSFAASSATARISPPASGFEAARVSPDVLRTPRGSSPAEIEYDSFEPDDTIDQANKIVVCTPQQHDFGEVLDIDWVKFWAWANIEYTIKTFGLGAANDTEIWLYDAERNEKDHNDDGDNPPASRIVWVAPANGTYFIKAAHAALQGGGDGFDYSLHVAESDNPCGEDFEPDNIMDDAQLINPDGMVQIHNFHGPCGGDVDWVKFNAITDTAYTIATYNLSGGNDTILGLYDENGITVTVNGDEVMNDDNPENLLASQIDWMADEGGTYYVKIVPFNPSIGGCNVGYNLKVVTSDPPPTSTFTPDPCDDGFEPDDIAGEAKLVAVNGGPQVDRTVNPAGDEDWTKFWALAGNEYTIQTSDLSLGNNTELYLYNANMQQLAFNDDIDPPFDLASRITWTASANGTYFVKIIHHKPSLGGCEFTYALEITSSVPCRDDYEDDDARVQAQPIIVDGGPQSHNFHVPCVADCEHCGHSADEADWVWFEAVEGVTYTIETSNLGGDNDTVLGLYDGSENEITSNDDDEPDNLLVSKIVWPATMNGTYYVKVSPFDRRVGGCDVSYDLEIATDVYTLTTNVDPAGSGSVAWAPAPPYHYGDVVTLTATAEPGWTFYEWSGALSGSDITKTFTMYGNSTVTATFTQDEYTLTVNVNPIDGGSVVSEPVQSTYHYGDVVTLTAIADPGWTFYEWSGDLSDSKITEAITMYGNSTVTATFAQGAYTLTVNTIGHGSVVSDPVQSTYHYSAVVTLTATADLGWTFTGWSGALSGMDNPDTVTMDSSKTVVATFTRDEYTLTVNVNPIDGGSVVSEPVQSTYHYSDVVTLTASAASDWTFAGWSGALSGMDNPGTITIDSSKVVTATFTPPILVYLPLVIRNYPPNQDPYMPSNPSPSDGATEQPIDVDLGWSGGDPDPGDTVTYDVHFGDTSPPPQVKSNHPSTTYDPGTLIRDTEYHWYIVARDNRGAETEGPEWYFTTEATCPCEDEHEPDNNSDDAKNWPALKSGEPYDSYMCEEHVEGGTEDDYYWFNITSSSSEVTLDLTVPDTVNYDLYLWCPHWGSWSSSTNPGQGVDEHIARSPTGTGECLAFVRSRGDSDNCNPYTLEATFK